MSAAPAEGAAGAAFPWDAAMAAGLGHLRLSPRDFWAMTPRELAAALGPVGAQTLQPPRRDELAALIRQFPDR
ncbi:MAG: rcc01693 family protein [Aurantimonas endophytica]|uniref:Putative phage protein (TIGR02216 family) n=1 Tax=Aurantimonas endophytica TaxID=1522175 RepID=A0A7W6HFI6_9HYPH|nr:rcc01693 family protein [Aurantimonas endophytica]MBB4004211.1 putative phage protein (TIGR02216 family) [Aurantimonas endophytica]MCO6405052.1 phage tail assembly chaperone [Aurantimonas endophytica]